MMGKSVLSAPIALINHERRSRTIPLLRGAERPSLDEFEQVLDAIEQKAGPGRWTEARLTSPERAQAVQGQRVVMKFRGV